MKGDRDAQALQALCRVAGAQAAGWGSARAPARAAAPAAAPLLRRKRLLTFALLGGASVVALAVVADRLARPAPAAVASLPAVAAPASETPAPLPTPAAAAAPSADPVRWEGDELAVDFHATPLQDAIAMLARATRATVSEGRLPERPVAVTLHLRTRDARQAWQRLLQDRAGYGIACTVEGCHVSLPGEVAAPADIATAGARGATPAHPAAAPADPIARQQQLELQQSQPDGSC